MSSAGHIMDMINRQRYNESLKNARRARFNRTKEAYLNEIHHHFGTVQDINELTSEERIILKQSIRSSIIQERRIAFLKTILVFVLALLLLGLIVRWIIKTDSLFLP